MTRAAQIEIGLEVDWREYRPQGQCWDCGQWVSSRHWCDDKAGDDDPENERARPLLEREGGLHARG